MTDSFIRFHHPSIGEEEIAEVVHTLRSGWLTTGPRVARFEQDFAAYARASHALAVNSATAGLHLALAALGIGPGDEVITSPMTFCATVHAILHVGATPVLADIAADGNIDPEQVERWISPRTRAIIPVHLAGLPCDMSKIYRLAAQRGIAVIEDAAHAAGAHYHGRPIGAGPGRGTTIRHACAFSFYATKNLTTGEGGMITTEDPGLAETIRMLSLHGVSHDAWDRYSENGKWHYDVLAQGFKYNLSDIQAAIGIHQLRKLDAFIERRARLAAMYNAAFGNVDELERPPDDHSCRHAWHLYMLRLNLNRLRIDRDQFMGALREKGIGASVHFIPIPLFRFFSRLPLAQYPCPRAIDLFPRMLSLPLYPAMTDDQVEYVAGAVQDIVKRSVRLKFAA